MLSIRMMKILVLAIVVPIEVILLFLALVSLIEPVVYFMLLTSVALVTVASVQIIDREKKKREKPQSL